MTNPIILTMEDGKEYRLEFDRKTVEYSERMGFNTDDIEHKMMIRVPELFWFSFRKNHPEVTKEESDKILFDELGGTTEQMTERLVQLYADAYMSLVNNEGKPKNPKVRVVM